MIRLDVNSDGFLSCSALQEMEKNLEEYNGSSRHGKKRIRIVAMSGASNVLGTLNDIRKVSEIVHRYGASLLVDCAQLAAHAEIDMQELGIDYLVFSGHKMYAPFGSGGLIARKGLLNFEPRELGAIKESGEENLMGIAAVAEAMRLLGRIDMGLIKEEERKLSALALRELAKINDDYGDEVIQVFGIKDPDGLDRKGPVISFHVKDVPHNIVAKMLAEKGGIGVRNGCFCAHMLVRSLICVSRKAKNLCQKHDGGPGLVRVSFGMENTEGEIMHFIATLREIVKDDSLKTVKGKGWSCPYLASTVEPVTETASRIRAFVEGVVRAVYDVSDLTGAAEAEASRVHAKNGEYYVPIATNTVICHIAAPSALPAGQQGMLNRLDSGMRGREYSEKMLELKADSSNDFVEQIRDTIKRAKEVYKKTYGDDYKNYTFKFDVACPSLDLVARVQNELGLPALAFNPEEGEGNMVQPENIMLALRALRRSMETNDIQSLINAYRFITGNKIESSITDIAQFAKTMLFTMPKMNVNELGKINTLIEENIKTAA